MAPISQLYSNIINSDLRVSPFRRELDYGTLGADQLLLHQRSLFLGGFRSALSGNRLFLNFAVSGIHRIPLIARYRGISKEPEKREQSHPENPSLSKPVYLLASVSGVVLLGWRWWVLNYGRGLGRNVFIMANIAIPAGVILCFYRLNGVLVWSIVR
jgi:hypothetical protein